MVSDGHPVVAVPADAERLQRLNDLLALVAEDNPFQRARLAGLVPLERLDDLARLPFTTKDDLVADQAAHPPYGTNLTFALERYTHLHQTSGTTGATLRVLDTPEDWAWWRRNLGIVFRAAGVGPADRVALAYSFGPYVQFWASYEGAQDVGAMVIALGGMDSLQRLRTIRDYGATTVLCTPTYAVHLVRIAEGNTFMPRITTMSSLRPRMPCGSHRPGCSAPHGSPWRSTTSPVR